MRQGIQMWGDNSSLQIVVYIQHKYKSYICRLHMVKVKQ